MAVAFDANASAVVTGTGVTALNSSNLTVGVGSNRAVVAQLVLSLKTAASVTVNWDNAGTPQSQTLIVSANGTGTIARAELWGLVNPTSGAKQARAAWTGASDAYINCTSFTGVDQTGGTTSFPHSTSATGTITGVVAFATAITSVAGNFTVAATALDIGSLSATTQTSNFLSNALACDGASSRATGAASVSHGWSGDTNPSHWVIVGTDILASGGGSPVTVALTNAAATFSAGTVVPSSAVPLTNALGTFSAGTLTPSSTVAVANALGTFSSGTITPTPTIALANAAATFSATSLTPSSSVALANALATWSAGNLTVPGDVTLALTGALATFSAGTMTGSVDVVVVPVSGASGSEYRRRRTGLGPSGFRKKRDEELVVLEQEKEVLKAAVEEVKVEIQYADSSFLKSRLNIELSRLEEQISEIEEEEDLIIVFSLI